MFPNPEWGHISQWAALFLGKSIQIPEEPAGALHEGSHCVGCTQQLSDTQAGNSGKKLQEDAKHSACSQTETRNCQ